jgi:hypothetical protein
MCVECFTEWTAHSNTLHSVVKEPHWANAEPFQLLSFSAQPYRCSILHLPSKSKNTPYIPTPDGGGFTALFR